MLESRRRAGEAARGFAVVASEVRALAQRSSDAAREINTLMSASSVQVHQGVDLVGQAGAALEQIVGFVSDISDHVSGIAVSAREQSVGLHEINTAMTHLNQATQQSATMFRQTTAASQSLNAEADALIASLRHFRTAADTGPNVRTVTKRSALGVQSNACRPSHPELATFSNGAYDDWQEF
jgi:methyl-accepting chemotaxis protein